MVNKQQVVELVPHYVAMLVIVFAAIGVLRAAVGDLGVWLEFAVILVLVFLYRPLIVRLDVIPTPSLWVNEEEERSV